jgi:hypothetical protein
MKLYGYRSDDLGIDGVEPNELSEMTLVATAAELRLIAKFLASTAELMEQTGVLFEHEHLSHTLSEFEISPQFVVANAQHYSC